MKLYNISNNDRVLRYFHQDSILTILKTKSGWIWNESYVNLIRNNCAKTFCIINFKTDNEATFNLVAAPTNK